MKKHLNPPLEVSVFNQAAGIWSAAKGSKVVGTILGIVTEYAILQHLFNQHITQFWQSAPAWITAATAAVVCVLLAKERIRYGNEVSKLLNSKAHRNALGWQANGIVLLVCIAIYGISIALSFVGSIATVTDALPAPELQTTTATDAATSAKIQAINVQYSADSAATAKQWQARIEAERTRHNAVVNDLNAQIKAGKHWLKPQLKAAQTKRTSEINELKATAAAALLRATATRQALVEQANSQAATEARSITDANNKAASRHTYLVSKATAYFPAMVVAALVMVFLGCFVCERFKMRAGITEINLPNEYDLLPGIGAEYAEALKSLFNGIARSGAAWIRSKAIPAVAVTDATAAELVRLELEKYKEQVLQYGANGIAATPQQIGFKQYNGTTDANDHEAKKSRYNENNEVLELFNTYKMNRQLLRTYQNKKASGNGKPETLQAGIERHSKAMAEAAAALQAAGYVVVMNKVLRRFELSRINN